MSFHDDLKAEMLARGVVTKELIDYIDDRINAILSNKMADGMGDLSEQVKADIVEHINKARIVL